MRFRRDPGPPPEETTVVDEGVPAGAVVDEGLPPDVVVEEEVAPPPAPPPRPLIWPWLLLLLALVIGGLVAAWLLTRDNGKQGRLDRQRPERGPSASSTRPSSG